MKKLWKLKRRSLWRIAPNKTMASSSTAAVVRAHIVQDIHDKLKLFKDEPSVYSETIRLHHRVSQNYPTLARMMTNNQVLRDFGEVMATNVAVNLFKLAVLDAGIAQNKITVAAQKFGIISSHLKVNVDEEIGSKRREDVSGMAEDGTKIKFEAKAVSLMANRDHNTVQFHITNLKTDVPRLVITLFDWRSVPPSAAVIFMPDHTKWGYRRETMQKLTIAAPTYDELLIKISHGEGILVTKIDLLESRYSNLVCDILAECRMHEGLGEEDTTVIHKIALQQIILKDLAFTPTGFHSSPFDGSDSNGVRIEIKAGTISPSSRKHELRAAFTEIKPELHDVLIAAAYLPCRDKLIVIENFKSVSGGFGVSGRTFCNLLGMFAEKSGGDKRALLASIHHGLGGVEEIKRIESELNENIKNNIRPEAQKRHLEQAVTSAEERRVEIGLDPKLHEEYKTNKSSAEKTRKTGFTKKILKEAEEAPLENGQRYEQKLEELAAAKRKEILARRVQNERIRRARRAEEAKAEVAAAASEAAKSMVAATPIPQV